MKWLGFVVLVLMFPVALWNMTGKQSQPDRVKFAAKSTGKSDSDAAPVISAADVIDLNGAADQTIKRIAEIDARILATKGELMRHESDRQKMAQELIKIQTKISEVLGSTSKIRR
jgi:hypothetical protein